MNQDNRSTISEVTKNQPCPHCGKPDWCYRLGELSVCKRAAAPAEGWKITGRKDKEGSDYYAPLELQKPVRPKSYKEFYYCDRQGHRLVKVTRCDDGQGKRDFYQSHWDAFKQDWIEGVPAHIKEQIPIYNYRAVQQAISVGEPVFMVEGEGCADLLIAEGLVATTTIGGSLKYRSNSYFEDLQGAELVLCPDRDEPGLKHMQVINQDFPEAKWLYAPPGDFYWQHPPKSGGLDIADWINIGATVEDIKAAIGAKKYGKLPKVAPAQGEINPSSLTAPAADEIFTQKALDALFGDTRWISINGHLHRWNGTHYELVNDSVAKANIARWCASTPVQSGDNWKYSYAKPSFVENIWNWAVFALAIDPALVNPPGINCLNGTVKLHWEGKKVNWALHPHNPDEYYTHTSQINYDPKADPAQCDRLLACLEPEQQDIFLKTLAASLDLATVRRYRGREVKALLCQGFGSNGKDSLREAASYLYCSGMTAATVSDFASYDQGRKFTLAKLEGSQVNWSSENSSFKNIDGLQSLKAAITGDPLDVERKRQDERPMLLNTVFLFNINEAPSLQAGLEAIQSRWAVLSFNKTYKIGADASKGELEADGRFRYDPQFLQTKVVPALLNKILTALPVLIQEGINYQPTRAALESIQQETNHLWAFAREVKLEYRENGRVYINELWERLRQWYIDNGTLSIFTTDKGKEQQEWHEQVDRRDKNVKAANQVYQRFSELFPKTLRLRDSQSIERKGQWYLSGIAFGEASEAISEAIGEAVTRSQSSSEASEAIEATLIRLADQIKTLEPLELRKILLRITNRVDASKIASLASLVDTARAVASPTASPTASLASPIGDPAMYADQSKPKKSTPIQALSVRENTIHSGDNSNNFFTPAHSCFRVGDRCKAKRDNTWGIPNGRICTILKIDNGVATVSYKGCRSPNGIDIPLAELELVK